MKYLITVAEVYHTTYTVEAYERVVRGDANQDNMDFVELFVDSGIVDKEICDGNYEDDIVPGLISIEEIK